MEGDLGWCRGGSSSNNWDLHAVVRFACGGGPGQGGAPSSPPPSDADGSFSLPSPMLQPHRWHDDPAVDELFQALLAAPEPEAPQQPSSPTTNEAPSTTTQHPTPPADEAPAKPRPSGRGGGGGPTRSKRKSKKRQVSKEVTRVPAGGPSPDLWAWRKYGQKPIKGSPYPRGYYRCSTDKDCKARKQVERCRADPATLVVTYTGEHSHPVPLHRNSLAGTTRAKPQPPQQSSPPLSESSAPSPADTVDSTTNKPQGSPSACAGGAPSSPATPPSVGVDLEHEDEEDDDTLAVRLLLQDADMAAGDDALLFLQPDDLAPVLGSGGGGVMLLPNNKPDEAASAAGGSSDAMLFPNNNKPDEPGPVSRVGAEDGVLFPKPGEPHPTTAQQAMNFVDDKFSVTGLSAWEGAAASGWGL